MPIQFSYHDENKSAQWNAAYDYVRNKYPGIIEGSSGWHRAVNNRMKKPFTKQK